MNNYFIYEEIGKGKYSRVFKGRKKKSIEYIAVKELEKSRRNKLLNEVKMFSGLKHQNILKFFSWYETKNHLWIILEYCPGGDLMALLEADPNGLNESIVYKFIRDMAQGLNYLHSKGIIYCDLRPSNILFNEYGAAKLSDLGNAHRLVDMISPTIGPDVEMSKKGSPYYMAPELFQQGGVYSFQSDLWALGCVAYELCTGQPPFQSGNFTELVDLILNSDYKTQDLGIFEMVKGLLNKDPLSRWGWDKICKFLNIQQLNVPAQPHFENWCKKNSYIQQLKNNASNVSNGNKNVDIVRLSLNVHKNMLREDGAQAKQYHKQESTIEKDLQLLNRDQDIMIGNEKKEEEESEDNEIIEEQQQPQQQQQQQQVELSNFNTPTPFQLKNYSAINQSPMPGGITPQMKKQTESQQIIPLEQLLQFSMDNAVKPIMGNNQIEKIMEASFLKDNLPFQFIPTDDINRMCETDQVEHHFEVIFKSLSSGSVSQNEKLNILNYFESILQNANIANRLLNSDFVPLLLKLLKLSKMAQLKHRICSVLALLIRHATVIEPELSQCGLEECMIEILNLKEQPIIKRKAAAALGEYLFYGATQMEEDAENPYWDISSQSYTILLKIIKSQNEDELVKSYCIKTLENITSQSRVTGGKFATPDVIIILLNQFKSDTSNNSTKINCCLTMMNLVNLDDTLSEVLINTLGLKNLVQIFMDGLQKIQQAMISIFIIYLLNIVKSNESQISNTSQVINNIVNKLLLEESKLIQSLVYLMDHGNFASRGKAAIAIMFLIKFNNIVVLMQLSDEKLRFYQILDKSLREQDEYLKYSLQHLLLVLSENIPLLIHLVSESLATEDESQSSKKSNNKSKKTNKKISGNQKYLNVLLQYTQLSPLQYSLFSSQNLPILHQLLNDSQQDTVQQLLFTIMSKMCTNAKILLKQQNIIINVVLKNSIEYMIKQESPEAQFNFLQFIIEIISALLQEEGIYDYPNFLKPYANDLNTIIIQQLIPQMKQLIQEPTSLFFYVLKLGSILLTYNAHFLPYFKKAKILQTIIDMFKPGSNNITGHTLNIVQKVIEGSMLEEINGLGLIEKSIALYQNFIQNNLEWAYEDLAQIMVALTTKIIQELSKTNKLIINPDNTLLPSPFPQELLFFQDQFLYTLQYGLQLMNASSLVCQQTTLNYLLHLIYFYPLKLTQYRQAIFNQLIPQLQPILARRIVKVLHWLVSLNEQKNFKVEKKDQLIQYLERTAKEDKQMAIALKDLPRYFA